MALTTPWKTLKREQPRDIGLYVCHAKACTVHGEFAKRGETSASSAGSCRPPSGVALQAAMAQLARSKDRGLVAILLCVISYP